MEKVKKKGKRFCPICNGDYPETHWHFASILKKKAGSHKVKT